MSERFRASQWVPYPVELVFAFFANPANLPHLMPPELETRLEDARIVPAPPRPVAQDPARRFNSVAAGVGSEILISFYLHPRWIRRVSWTVRITEFVWYSHFCDEQICGPFKSFRHRHSICAETRDGQEGTQVTDEIEYALPFGLAGRLAAGYIHRDMERSFAHRQQRLPQILAAAAQQATRRS